MSRVLRSCARALDLGCGTGLLVKRLAGCCKESTGIERDHAAWERANAEVSEFPPVQILEGDFMSFPFQANQFDLVTAVAVLHHVPLVPALTRMRDLVAPGGVLAVIGLYRPQSLLDWAWQFAGIPIDWAMKTRHGYAEVDAPMQAPQQTLREVKAACRLTLPGAEIKRRVLYRYSLLWRKPGDSRRDPVRTGRSGSRRATHGSLGSIDPRNALGS